MICHQIFEILADSNQEYYNYIIGWFASGLQKVRKTGVILCFIGAAGVGKSLLFSECDENHPIFQTIYGGVNGHYMIGQGVSALTARFNIMSAAKLFAVCEELPAGAATANMDALKHVAGATHVIYEAKHADAAPQLDRKNVVCLSNHEDSLGHDGQSGETSRKFAVFTASDKYSQSNRDADSDLDDEAFTFFRQTDDAQANPETQRAFFWYLKTLDLSAWRSYNVPLTPIMRRYKANANAIPSWLSELTSGDPSYASSFTWPVTAFRSSLELYSNFTAWAKLHAPTNKDTFKMFSNKLAAFAEQHSDILVKSNPGGQRKGYKLVAPLQLHSGE